MMNPSVFSVFSVWDTWIVTWIDVWDYLMIHAMMYKIILCAHSTKAYLLPSYLVWDCNYIIYIHSIVYFVQLGKVETS